MMKTVIKSPHIALNPECEKHDKKEDGGEPHYHTH